MAACFRLHLPHLATHFLIWQVPTLPIEPPPSCYGLLAAGARTSTKQTTMAPVLAERPDDPKALAALARLYSAARDEAQALALYGLQKGSGVTDKIGDTLGLDEISIGSDWETSDSALMLGKQISDRLYLTYAVGLFDAISTVMLRYTLTRQLHLEAQSSSKSQAIDLIWEKELE